MDPGVDVTSGTMRILIFGNSGSGKSTYAKARAREHSLPHLDLDSIVWEPGRIAVMRPPDAIISDLRSFLDREQDWVIEGCYGELVEAAAPQCTQLVFLNPGLDACLRNNERRPWEPHKYGSPAEQEAMLRALQEWVAGYFTRRDSWSYEFHRRLFAGHEGLKVEYQSAVSFD